MNRRQHAVVAAVLAVLIAAAGTRAVTPATAQAYSTGIGEQTMSMFSSPLFAPLRVRQARLIVSYDVATAGGEELAATDAWLAMAHKSGVEPLVAFNHHRSDDCQGLQGPRRCEVPTIPQYIAAVTAFRARYPWVRVFSPWNEVNNASQPTFHKPKLAAALYEALRTHCVGCQIVGLDVLDTTNISATLAYTRAFLRAIKVRPKIWGLHNYSDTNRLRWTGTRRFLAAVKGEVWLTETGGIVAFGKTFAYDEVRAATSLRFLFRMAGSSPRIRRVYLYAWSGSNPGARFDAGLMGTDGNPRPGYAVVRAQLAGLR